MTQALQCEEQNSVLFHSWFWNSIQTNTQPNYKNTKAKLQYIAFWKDAIKPQKKMELYLQLKSDYKPEYLSCVKKHKVRKTLTK